MSTRLKVVLAALAVVALAVGGGLWWFFDDDAPAEVSLEAAAAGVTTTISVPAGTVPPGGTAATPTGGTAATPTGGTADAGTASAGADALSGTWVVDTETGEFDYDRATGTFAGFWVQEQLAGVGAATAVGRTGDVTGSITIDGSTVTDAAFTIDLSTITTNESRRDNRVQQALKTAQHPTAAFTLTEPIPIPLDPAAAGGGPVAVTAVGDLTIAGVTRTIEMPLEAQLVGATIVVVGSTELTFSDFGVAVPSAPIVLSADDHGVVEIQVLLNRT